MIPHRKSALLAAPHGFFGREGGVSEGVYASLNASYASGDDGAAVSENRARIGETLGAAHVLTAKQVHSDRAVFIAAPFTQDERPEADALVTATPGLALGALAADCVPILMEASGLVAAVHAGWRGSLAGVIGSAVRLMTEHGAEPGEIRAAVGPCLRRESFEVRGDLVDAVLSAHPDAKRHFAPLDDERRLYDHVSFVPDRLLEAGIAPGHIDDVGGDTLAETDRFFSYRGARKAGQERFGHNLSAIALPSAGRS